MKNHNSFIPYTDYREYPTEEMIARSKEFYDEVNRRRTVRDFSTREVPVEVIQNCVQAAGTAPSGAHQQPWTFVVVSNPDLKKEIRIGAEKEESLFYHQRASEEYLRDLEPFDTDENKPFLEEAPYLIVIFQHRYGLDDEGNRKKHYYISESVGIATGVLITALHHSGLVTLTHTPSPMKFLNPILSRPERERPFLVLAVGYPADGVQVPDIKRKSLGEIAVFK